MRAARGARHRPAEHVRLGRQGDPGPRLRVEEGHRAHPVLHARSPSRTCMERYFAELVDYGFTALDGGRPRRDRDRREGPRRVAAPLLLRRRGGHDRARTARAAPRDRRRDRPRPALDLHDPDRPRRRGHRRRRARRPLRRDARSAARSAGRCPRRPSPTRSPSSARSSCSPRAPATSSSARTLRAG